MRMPIAGVAHSGSYGRQVIAAGRQYGEAGMFVETERVPARPCRRPRSAQRAETESRSPCAIEPAGRCHQDVADLTTEADVLHPD